MWTDALWVVSGLALIIQGGNLFVAAAVRIAKFLRMPRVVVGTTLVSLATTTPEMVVSVMSGMRGESELAVGNAVGSCLCNVGLILGLTAVMKTVEVHRKAILLPLAAMGVCGGVLVAFGIGGLISRAEGWVLIAIGFGYYVYDFSRHWKSRDPVKVREATAIEADVIHVGRAWFQTRPGTVVQFLAGAGVVVLGSRLLVDGAVSLAGGLGVPAMVVGLTVVAVGTSMPELITAITSSRNSVSDLAVGNVIGANIANLTFIVGVAAVFAGVRIEARDQWLNFPALAGMVGLLTWMLVRDPRLTRREGVWLMVTYGLYLVIVTTVTVVRGV